MGVTALREAGAGLDEEEAFARHVFVWRPGAADRVIQVARNVKAVARYELWKLANPD